MKRATKSEFRTQNSEIVLFAVTGMSPAIITETIWALANETPVVIPDRVVVVTTIAGRTAIQRELFDAGNWDKIREALAAKRLPVDGKLRFGSTADDIRVFTRADARGRSVELEDIRTPADNEAAADFLLEQLRPFTENPDIRLICSLAGGRKTMGALLYACLSLIGRETDRLTHVLVNEPFDDPRLQPRFYFPTAPPTQHQLAKIGNQKLQRVSSASAKIDLADVPFVPLRNLFPRELSRPPGRFMNLVRQYRTVVEQLSAPPRVELSDDEPVARINGMPVRLSPTVFVLLAFLVQRARRGQPAFPSYYEALAPFKEFAQQQAAHCSNPFDFRTDVAKAVAKWDETETQDLRKQVNALKAAFRQAGLPPATMKCLLPHRGHFGIRIKV